MSHLKTIAILLTSLALAPALAAVPEAYQAEYEVLRNGRALGSADIRVSATADGSWEMRSETRGTRGVAALAGVELSERSRFHWTADRLEAIEYDYRQKAATRSRERSVRVDTARGSILTRDRGNESRLAYQPGVLDRHILPLAIARDLAAGKTGTLRYLVADRGDIDEHAYRIVGRESVSTPGGQVDAVRVQRQRDNDARSTTLWLDPARGYLPVRVVQHEGSDQMETRLLRSSR
jgi:hypothetical protein